MTDTTIADRLPKWMGLTAGSLMCSYGLAFTAAEQIWGRPSSTEGLGFVMAPILGAIVGLTAAFAGATVRAVLVARRRGLGPPPALVPRVLTAGVIVMSMGFLVWGRADVLRREEVRRPRVWIDSPKLQRLLTAAEVTDRVVVPELYSGLTNTTDAHPITWNNRPVRVEPRAERVVVTDAAGRVVTETDLHQFDYILRLHAAEVCPQADGLKFLAVLVGLRATGHRAMVLVYDTNGRLIYQEHLERTRGTQEGMFTGRIGSAEAFGVEIGTTTVWSCAAAPVQPGT